MSIVVIGGGQAAASFVQKFRSLDQERPIVILSEETHPPYQRPPLSKAYLAGEMERERLLFKPESWYEENNISLRLGEKVTRLDRETCEVELLSGERISYDDLVFATGSRPRKLPEALTQNAKNIYEIRGLDDIENMKDEFERGRKLAIIGGGYIGLEAAAVARKFGLEVVLIESAPRILGRVASKETADYIRALHQAHGVEIIEDIEVEGFDVEKNRVSHVRLSNAEKRVVDFVISGIGVLPNSEIAEASGIHCEDGIIVNAHCQSNDPHIYAVGDCARFQFADKMLRLESVGNAIDQGNLVASHLAGESVPYAPRPWFWSDQYDKTLQIAGLSLDYDEVITRGETDAPSISFWYYKGDQLIAVDAISDPRSYMIAKRVIEAGKNIPKEVAADVSADLKPFMS